MKYILAILFALSAHAQQFHGQDVLGLARQDVKMLVANWQDGQCVGVLAGAFGGTIAPVESIIKTGKAPCARFHLSFCNHNNQCGPGECKPTDLKCMASKAKSIDALAVRYPAIIFYISPRLEYSSTDKKLVTSWFTTVKKAAPHCTLVASAMGGYIPPGVLVERHGNTPGYGDVTSNDGANYFDADVYTEHNYNKIAKVVSFAWTNRYNLRLTSEKKPPLPPLQRPLTNRIGKDDFLQMQQMWLPSIKQPDVPGVCANTHKLDGKELWKTHSEDYGKGNDSRGNKPLFIAHSKSSRMEVLNQSGTRIGCTKLYGSYQAGYYRHYVGSCSGDSAMDLYRKSGEWAFIKDGNTCVAVQTIRRMPYFHD